jgi:NO-binding membrane sensor protein with MHYT domain
MHFVAMLAFILPTPMSYDIGLTTLSLVVAMFTTGGSLAHVFTGNSRSGDIVIHRLPQDKTKPICYISNWC